MLYVWAALGKWLEDTQSPESFVVPADGNHVSVLSAARRKKIPQNP